MMRQTESREYLEAEASYHQFFLAPLDTTPVYDGRDTGPVAGVVDGGTALIVYTGCMDGVVHLTVSLADAPPPADDSWEVQETVSITIDAPLYIWAPTGGFARRVDGDPWFLQPKKVGPHRFRVSARGRGEDYAEYTITSPEHFLIQVWPETSLRPRETARDDGFGLDA
ncbi:hypothetical protein [Specibacter sp. NPDC078692]|uniref:hypothetical protein n=1 Tax=Specibacter sp. NPDC078692 TaxID=3155818 RepID=UPI00343D54D4